MAKTLRLIRNIMGVAGFIFIYGYVSTIDFYVNELGAQAPESAITSSIVGAVLIFPTVTYWTSRFLKMRKEASE